MKPIRYIIIIACAGILFGCASIPPTELTNARQAYQQASNGQAAQLAPAELHKAHVALAIAEKSFHDDPKSFRTRDLAYVADRKAKMAEALATTAAENAATAKANKDYEATQTEIMKNTKEDLAASERSAVLKTEQLAAEQKARIEAGQKARLDAENKAAAAKAEAQHVKESTDAEARRVKELAEAKAAAAEAQHVKEEEATEAENRAATAKAEAQHVKESTAAETRRVKELAEAEARRLAEQKDHDNNTIIILEKGKKVVLKGVNFEFNKATLTNESETTLTMAFNALIANPDVQIEISGHTDNVGSQQYNQALSLKRAQAVKNWLVKKGIASNRMKTVGKGQNEPVASNETDEGRAENRRIEFYVQQ